MLVRRYEWMKSKLEDSSGKEDAFGRKKKAVQGAEKQGGRRMEKNIQKIQCLQESAQEMLHFL